MASKVTQEDIINMNNLYLKLSTYAAVARETGFSPSTVKKYIIPNYKPVSDFIKRFEGNLPDLNYEIFRIENWCKLCELSEDERKEIEELWEELSL